MSLDTVSLLKCLSGADSPSGYEDEVLKVVEENIKPYVDLVKKHKMNTLIAAKRGQNGKKLGIFAHADEIGFVVAKLEERGFARLEPIGGVDPKVVLSQRIKIFTNQGIATGVVGFLPPHLQKEDQKDKVPDYNDIYVDVSCSPLCEAVSVGDICVIEGRCASLGDKLSGKALDNRASCAALILAARELETIKNRSDVYFIFSSQEEIAGPGAVYVAYELGLDGAIVVDVTHGNEHVPQMPQIKISEGPALAVGPVVNREFYKALCDVAKRHGVRTQIEPTPGRSHTDTDEVQITRSGIKTALVSIPLMYMHTPVELVDPRDVEETARLLSLASTVDL